MRQLRATQQSLVPCWSLHQHTQELRMVGTILDDHPEIARRVHRDLIGGRDAGRGRRGLAGDQVLRIALLKQIHGLSYRELEFHLQDSEAFRAFVGLGFSERPSFQTLQANVKRIQPRTWEAIHGHLIGWARAEGIERGDVIRTDTTGVEANIHEPSDSSLLWDCVRVMTRLLKRAARRKPALRKGFSDRTRRARRRAYQLRFERRRIDLETTYRDLIQVTVEVREAAERVLGRLSGDAEVEAIAGELRALLPLVDRVIDQSRRRVLEGERVPAEEKVVSIFEPHADILVKGSRDVIYGHKVCLTGGKSSLVLDCVIEDGNPADSTLVERTLRRHITQFGRAPRQAAMDGGFASQDNLRIAKQLGVEDVAFHRKSGLEVSEMARSAWVFRRLRNFRSGIEGCISTLKRAFQMDRCTWRGPESFKAYVWTSVTAFNLIVLARHKLASLVV